MLLQKFKKWLTLAKLDIKPHQIRGMEFCIERENTISPYGVRGGIIADEMGLGKTILMLGCIISNFMGPKRRTNTLIVLPPSLLPQWIAIFKKFTGHSPLIYHGKFVKSITSKCLKTAPIVITTYGMIASNKKGGSPLWNIEWNRLIMDEAHHIRNMKSGIFCGAKKIKADIKWLVTGTPIQNKKSDLYALCIVLGLKPALFRSPLKIKIIIGHHVLRRTKKDVGINLPPLIEEIINVPWSSEEEEELARQIHYHATFSRVTVKNVNSIIHNMTNHSFATLIRARQVCVFPRALQTIMKKLQYRSEHHVDTKLLTCSKVSAITKHIISRSYNKRRKIVFCYYKAEIDIICALLREKNIGVCAIDGRTKKKERILFLDPPITQEKFGSVCKKWNRNNYVYDFINPYISPQVIVVQIQTACEGLNLQHFQEVYFTSPHWNPAVEDQAIARAHRIGQNEKVNVFRFVMENFKTEGDDCLTLDNYCIQIQDKKRELAKILD